MIRLINAIDNHPAADWIGCAIIFAFLWSW